MEVFQTHKWLLPTLISAVGSVVLYFIISGVIYFSIWHTTKEYMYGESCQRYEDILRKRGVPESAMRVKIGNGTWYGLIVVENDGHMTLDTFDYRWPYGVPKAIPITGYPFIGCDNNGPSTCWISEYRQYKRYLVEADGLMGFINGYGKEVIKLRYVAVQDYEHLYGSSVDIYDDRRYDFNPDVFFASGCQPVKSAVNGKWGYVGHCGDTIIPFQYDDAYPFHLGYACVGIKDSKGFMRYGLITAKGETIVKPVVLDSKIRTWFTIAEEMFERLNGREAMVENGEVVLNLAMVQSNIDSTINALRTLTRYNQN